MENSGRIAEKSTNLLVGSFLIAAGIIALLLNFSLLPVIGTVIGIPCIAIGVYFLRKHKRTSGKTTPPKARRNKLE